jgi:putative iron-regulated protein
MRSLFSLQAVFLAIAISGCSLAKSDKPNDGLGKPVNATTDQQKAIVNLATNVILKTYKDLEGRSGQLHQQALALRSQPTQTNLQRACELWHSARVSWEQTEGFLFGPVHALNLDPKLDTWPTDVGGVGRILSSGAPITVESLQSMDTNLRGFHTIEYLLFGDGKTKNSRAVETFTNRELEYLVAATGDLAKNAGALAFAWEHQNNPDNASSPAYVDVITRPNLDNEKYPSESAVIGEFLNGITGITDEVANGKIAEPLLGDVSKIESKFAWNSVADFSDNIRSVKMIYTGRSESGNGYGLKTLLEAHDKALADEIEQEIEASIIKLQAIGESNTMSFNYALQDASARGRIGDAQAAIQKLFETLDQKARPYFVNGSN